MKVINLLCVVVIQCNITIRKHFRFTDDTLEI